MTAFLRAKRWSPYLAGAGIGVLSWITFGLMNKALGASTTFVRIAGLIESSLAPDHVKSNPYYAKFMTGESAAIDWQFMLIIGVFLGALISALLSRSIEREHVPALWKWRFGPNRVARYLAAFVGGFLVLFGARLAGGCTSGHALSGGLQFALSGWVFFATFFAAAMLAAFAIFGKEGRHHVV